MRRAARSGNYHLQASFLRRLGILEKQIGRAMSRNDFRFVGDAKGVEDLRGVLHRVPIGL